MVLFIFIFGEWERSLMYYLKFSSVFLRQQYDCPFLTKRDHFFFLSLSPSLFIYNHHPNHSITTISLSSINSDSLKYLTFKIYTMCRMIRRYQKVTTSTFPVFQDFSIGNLVMWLILSMVSGNTQKATAACIDC